jgi:hypothetical protein
MRRSEANYRFADGGLASWVEGLRIRGRDCQENLVGNLLRFSFRKLSFTLGLLGVKKVEL